MTGQAIAMAATADGVSDDPSARLGRLFDTHHPRLYRLARRLTRTTEDARDLVQEAFLRAARHAKSIPAGTSSEEAWLVRILINLARDRWRQAEVRRKGSGTVLEGLRQSSDPEPALIARSVVWQALDQLPPRRRAIVVLYELEGSTIPAIARLLGVAAVTVRWHLSVGRRELAAAVSKGNES